MEHKKIYLSRSKLSKDEANAVANALELSYLGMGELVFKFEEELQQYISPKVEVACVANGTSALQLALQAAGIGKDDKVLVPTITFVASFQAISATGAIPVACDVDYDTALICLDSAKSKLDGSVKAIMPVHYAGQTRYLDKIYAFAREHNLRVIEDAAHAFGCKWKQEKIGANGDIVCFSFDGIKNITCAEGGAVVSKDKSIIDSVRKLRQLGINREGDNSQDFNVYQQGWRYHMSNINAAIGRVQLQKLDEFAFCRQKFAMKYSESLSGNKHIKLFDLCDSSIVPHIFPLLLVDVDRDHVRNYLKSYNIETGVHYKPNHLLSYFSGGPCPIAEKMFKQMLTLPLHCQLTDNDVDFVGEMLQKALL